MPDRIQKSNAKIWLVTLKGSIEKSVAFFLESINIKTLKKNQIFAAIEQMPNVERLELIEFALQLVREEMEKPKKISLGEAAEIMLPYYAEGSDLTEFVDAGNEVFMNIRCMR